jgi:hypothetical protein
MVFFEVAEDSGLSRAQQAFLRETLYSTLHEADPATRYLPAPDRAAGGTPGAADQPAASTPAEPVSGVADRALSSRQAREAACDAWLRVRILRGATVLLEVANSYTGAVLLSQERQLGSGEEPRRLALQLWGPPARSIAELELRVERERRVLIRGAPGTELTGLGDSRITLTDGEVRRALEYPAVYEVNAFSTRHYAEQVRFFLGEEGADITLDQDERSRFLLGTYAQEAAYPGLELSFLLVPPRLFLRAAAHTYAAGLVPFAGGRDPDGDPQRRHLLVSEPLSQFRFLAGVYWNDTRGLFYAYSALGAAARVLHAEEYTGLEPIAPWGFELANGFELQPQRKLRFFFEHSPSFIVIEEPELIGDAFSEIGAPEPVFVSGNGAYIDILSFRLGIRYQW